MSSESGVPILLFFTASTSGPARRMESLLAHLARKERGRLSIARIDTLQSPEWVERLQIEEIPTLVLVKGKRPVARLDAVTAVGERWVDPSWVYRNTPPLKA